MKHDELDVYALRDLKQGRSGSFAYFVIESPIRANLLIKSMARLQDNRLIAITGKMTLGDAARLIEENGPYYLPEYDFNIPAHEQERLCRLTNEHAFGYKKGAPLDFSLRTEIKLTLRGHWFLSSHKQDSPTLWHIIQHQGRTSDQKADLIKAQQEARLNASILRVQNPL